MASILSAKEIQRRMLVACLGGSKLGEVATVAGVSPRRLRAFREEDEAFDLALRQAKKLRKRPREERDRWLAEWDGATKERTLPATTRTRLAFHVGARRGAARRLRGLTRTEPEPTPIAEPPEPCGPAEPPLLGQENPSPPVAPEPPCEPVEPEPVDLEPEPEPEKPPEVVEAEIVDPPTTAPHTPPIRQSIEGEIDTTRQLLDSTIRVPGGPDLNREALLIEQWRILRDQAAPPGLRSAASKCLTMVYFASQLGGRTSTRPRALDMRHEPDGGSGGDRGLTKETVEAVRSAIIGPPPDDPE